ERCVVVDTRALRAGQEGGQHHDLSCSGPNVEQVIAWTETREVEGVDDLFVAARTITHQLRQRCRLIEGWIRDPEDLFYEVIALKNWNVIEVLSQNSTAKGSRGDPRSESCMTSQRRSSDLIEQLYQTAALMWIARA